MRHRVKKNTKFTRKDGAHARDMVRNLATSFFVHKHISTTTKRAKAVLPLIDKLINVVNSKDKMNAIRFIGKYLYTKNASIELFEVAKKYSEKKSGFTRITPVKLRDGDTAKIVKIELI